MRRQLLLAATAALLADAYTALDAEGWYLAPVSGNLEKLISALHGVSASFECKPYASGFEEIHLMSPAETSVLASIVAAADAEVESNPALVSSPESHTAAAEGQSTAATSTSSVTAAAVPGSLSVDSAERDNGAAEAGLWDRIVAAANAAVVATGEGLEDTKNRLTNLVTGQDGELKSAETQLETSIKKSRSEAAAEEEVDADLAALEGRAGEVIKDLRGQNEITSRIDAEVAAVDNDRFGNGPIIVLLGQLLGLSALYLAITNDKQWLPAWATAVFLSHAVIALFCRSSPPVLSIMLLLAVLAGAAGGHYQMADFLDVQEPSTVGWYSACCYSSLVLAALCYHAVCYLPWKLCPTYLGAIPAYLQWTTFAAVLLLGVWVLFPELAFNPDITRQQLMCLGLFSFVFVSGLCCLLNLFLGWSLPLSLVRVFHPMGAVSTSWLALPLCLLAVVLLQAAAYYWFDYTGKLGVTAPTRDIESNHRFLKSEEFPENAGLLNQQDGTTSWD